MCGEGLHHFAGVIRFCCEGLHPSLIYCALSGLLGDVVVFGGCVCGEGLHPSLIYCGLLGLLGDDVVGGKCFNSEGVTYL